MGKVYERLDDKLRTFIGKQKMYFVASAPLSGDGHVNVSPKGYDSFHIIDDRTVAYLDLGGSGIETHAHVLENGRVTIMFCAFEGRANILRLYGKGRAYDFAHPEYSKYLKLFPDYGKVRAVIVVDVTRIQDSCGWGVPFFEFTGERDQLKRSESHRNWDEWVAHRYKTNAVSIDGLPGLTPPEEN